jgi:hypothetical protein
MDNRPQALLDRLAAIGQSLKNTGHALALLGLGSVGQETERLDEYSDLDFFAIVEAGYKSAFIENLDWFSSVCPIAYHFKNTADGYKLLFEDGIFCEMAVFEPQELANIPFAGGRIIWKDAAFDENLTLPKRKPASENTVEWLLGEALTNLYVGLGRYHRGEKLSAARFIQGYAVDRILELSAVVERPRPGHEDSFALERRYERRFPATAAYLPQFIQGYERSRESAQAILAFLDAHFEVNPAMRTAILELCERKGSGPPPSTG